MTQTPLKVSVETDASSLECFSKQVLDMLSGLLLDLSGVISREALHGLSPRLDKTVGGADNLVVSFGFDPIPLDQQLRAALRAGGFDIPDSGHFTSPVGSLSAPTVDEGPGAVMTLGPDAQP